MVLNFKPVFFVLLFWAIGGCLSAQEITNLYNDLKFRHYTINDGLSHTSITDINQDYQGFIWIGTKNGLNRFDGIDFKNYFSEEGNPESISNNYINALFVDSRNNLWVGTSRGLNLYKGNDSFKNFYFNKSNTINSICEDQNKKLWIGTDCKKRAYYTTHSGLK